MICLPEKYVYGWLFSIRSKSPDLLNYKRHCYEILFDHFHGTITGRRKTLADKQDTERQITEAERNLLQVDDYKDLLNLRKYNRSLNKKLRHLDKELVKDQLTLDI